MHHGLVGRAPDDVASDDNLKFILKERAANAIQHNQAIIEARGRRLEQKGGFRNELAAGPRGFERSFKPRYDDQVHRVAKVVGGTVFSETGEAHATRHVLAVPSTTGAVATEGMHGGSDQTDRLRLKTIEPYKDRISTYLGDLGKYEHEVASYMKELGMEPLMVQGLSYRSSASFGLHGSRQRSW